MSEQMMPLEQFLKLDTDEQVEKLRGWKLTHTLKDIREAWNFKHSAQYYMLLKKLRIYERVVNKSDKLIPIHEPQGYAYREDRQIREEKSVKTREDHFSYQLNTTLSGVELAEKLERAAHFLRGENKAITIRLHIEAADTESNTSESS
ncbi:MULTISPECIES: hypothetical protein [unclassified Paenibacillus]|uniref:hypothetical protein n=1 Tax=unclassified Paenibacillus TaxID=185978 RepID=UPI002F40C912